MILRTPTPLNSCQLCDCRVDVADLPVHLRTVHQVVPGEATIADIPVGHVPPHATLAATPQEPLVAVVA